MGRNNEVASLALKFGVMIDSLSVVNHDAATGPCTSIVSVCNAQHTCICVSMRVDG